MADEDQQRKERKKREERKQRILANSTHWLRPSGNPVELGHRKNCSHRKCSRHDLDLVFSDFPQEVDGQVQSSAIYGQ